MITVLLTSSLFGQEWVDWNVLGYANIAFHPDSSHILYLGTASGGALIVSYDSGNTLDTLFDNLSVLDIEFHPDSPDTLIIASGNMFQDRTGVLKVVRNGADYDTTWIDTDLDPGTEGMVTCVEVDPFSPDTMLAGISAFGAGTLWKTTNGGQTWYDSPGSSHGVVSIMQHPAYPNQVVYTTPENSLFRSYDWGETWSESAEWGGERESLSSIAMFPDYPGRILISSSGNGAYISNTFGDTWDSWNDHIPSIMVREIMSDPNNPTHLYLATNDSIFFSNDFGESWSDYTFNIGDLSQGIKRLQYDSLNHRLFAGHQRYGLFSLDLNTVSVYDTDQPVVPSNSFEITSIYPNPFNPSTTIEYELPGHSEVKLVIYDVAGHEVQTLVLGAKSQGSYDINWDGTDQSGKQVPSGMYFARLQAGEYSSVVKMVYLR